MTIEPTAAVPVSIPIHTPAKISGERTLAYLLQVIKQLDPSVPNPHPHASYPQRNSAIYLALRQASQLGYPCGFCPSENPEWPVALIDLPTGQISWHLPAYPGKWDLHTTEDKYDRIDAYTITTSVSPLDELVAPAIPLGEAL